MSLALVLDRMPAPRTALWLAIAAVLAAMALMHGAWRSMAHTWLNSETYAHGLLIVPLALWLAWRARERVRAASIAPAPAALGAVALLVLVWLVGAAGEVMVVQQLSAVLMIAALVWLLAGGGVLRALAFPLGFLLFAVPMGDFLVPPLMNLTADATVFLLRATGIPVYREGLFFTLPTGSWSVVEACSGVRYLIASLAVGALYAYLMYRSWRRRALFMLAAALVPVAANVLRAYGIVLLGHYSDMTLAVGVDHLLYGWLFFGAVIVLLFAAGARWREEPAPRPAARAMEAGARAPLLLALFALALLAAGAAYAAQMHTGSTGPAPAFALPAPPPAWHAVEAPHFAPHYRHARAQAQAGYHAQGTAVGVFAAYYRDQRGGRALAAWDNGVIAPESREWRLLRRETRVVDGLRVVQSEIQGVGGRRLVWHWYWTSAGPTVSRYRLKGEAAWARLRGARDDAAVVVLHADAAPGTAAAADALEAYARAWWPAMARALAEVGRD